MSLEYIEKKYIGKKVDPTKFDMSELGERLSPEDGYFVWGYMTEEDISDIEIEKLKKQFIEELKTTDTDYDESEADDDEFWDAYYSEFEDWVYDKTGYSIEDIENGWKYVHLKFTVAYEIDEEGKLILIGELWKEKYVDTDVHGEIYEDAEVTDDDYDELDEKLSEIVIDD